MRKYFISYLFFILVLNSSSAYASGVAARRGDVNIQGGKKTYRINSIPQPGKWPEPKPQESAPEEVPEEAPEEEKRVEQYFPPPEVLVSSPQFQEPEIIRDNPAAQVMPQQQAIGVDPQLVALLNRFDQSSELWFELKDVRVKALVLSRYIDLYRQFDIVIEQSPLHYANMIDSMARKNPQMFIQPMDQILRVVAILEYDYNNGQNKDAMARGILDEKGFVENRRRLGRQ